MRVKIFVFCVREFHFEAVLDTNLCTKRDARRATSDRVSPESQRQALDLSEVQLLMHL